MTRWSRLPAWEGGFESRVLAVVSIGWFTVFAARMVINTLLPEIKQAYVLSNNQAGLVVTSLGITYALMQFPSGIVADLVGEVRVLTAVLFSVGLMGFPAVLQSHFLGFVPSDTQASAFGMYRSAYLLVASTSPVVIGTIADVAGLDVMLLVLAGLSAVGVAGFAAGAWIGATQHRRRETVG